MNKANGGDGIPVELFQILKDDAVHTLPTLNVPTVSFWHVGFHIPAGLGLISWWHAKHNFFWMIKIKSYLLLLLSLQKYFG